MYRLDTSTSCLGRALSLPEAQERAREAVSNGHIREEIKLRYDYCNDSKCEKCGVAAIRAIEKTEANHSSLYYTHNIIRNFCCACCGHSRTTTTPIKI